MRLCHSCKRELDAAALAAGRCSHCGAVVRVIAQRTFDITHAPRASGDQPAPGGPQDPMATVQSGEVPPTAMQPGPTIETGRSDTAGGLGGGSLRGDGPDQPVSETIVPETKAPTWGDQSELTIELPPPDPDQKPPGRRSTHTLESDRTIDLDMSSLDAKNVESQWKDTFDRGTRQGQTIRQRETVSGFRSSLPVKSRYVRESRKEGVPAPTSPAEVPDYELLDIIGEGGMGVVYAAKQSSIARTVAVKMLKHSTHIRDEQRDKFISEAVVTGELDHPNIVPIYDLGANEQGALFYSMKRVSGTPWDKVINQKQLDENLNILLRAADAVAFAHDRGVIHRDLKPENIMLGDYGEVLVMDWGLARIAPQFVHRDTVYQVDSLGGTPAYMAPEMARGPIEIINVTSDVYLLGAILYEIVCGQPPHSGRDVMQCLMAASQNRIDPIREKGELTEVALKAMSTRQEDRYQTVKEFQEAIRTYQSHSESLVLTAHANQNLRKARESDDYQLYARALYGSQEALSLWDANNRARLLLTEAQHDYAKCALGKGDLDLAASLLESQEPEHQDLIAQIDVARAERDARARRLRYAKLAVAALVAGIIATVTIAYFQVSRARDVAVVARDEAVDAKQKEEVARKDADLKRQEAETAQAQEAIARQDADQKRREAEIAQQKETAARLEADKQKLAAEEAKLREEYEAYVAQIGLAAAKINDNAYDFARDLLADATPDLRNWEWGRLVHLCRLSAGTFRTGAPIAAVAYSPDGQSIVVGDMEGTATIRDARTGEIRHQLPHGQYVLAVAYSNDGSRIATGSSDGTIQILDAAAGSVIRQLRGHTDGVLTVRFSPDGRQLLSGAYDNTARLWDVETGETIHEFKGHNWWVWAAEFSPTGERILTAGQDGKAIVWRKRTREELADPESDGNPWTQLTEFAGHDGAIYSARFSPNGKLVVTGGYDKMVMVWNPDEVKPADINAILQGLPEEKSNYLRLASHDGPVRCVNFSPNGELVVSGGDDNAVLLWDVAAGELVKSLRGHGNEVRACTFSPDGQLVLSGGQDETLRLWNIQGYQEVRVLHSTVFSGHFDAILSASFSRDGQEIVTASRDRTARLWDAKTGETVRQFEEGHEFLATNAAFFPDGRRLATGAGDGSVRLWDLVAGTEIMALTPTGRVGAVAVSPDGNWVVTGSPGTEVQIWDSRSGQPATKLSGHRAPASALTFSASGDLLATGDERGNIRLWRCSDGSEWTFEKQLEGHNGTISALRFTPDAQQLVSASGDRTATQWDIASGQELRQLVMRHPDWVSGVDLSGDGSLAITTCDDGAARVWRLADGAKIAETKAPVGVFSAASIAPDGRQAVLASPIDKLVRIWTLPTADSGADGAVSQASPEVMLDFNQLGGLIWSTTYAPDGTHILTLGGNDAQVWNLETRRRTSRLSPHGAVASAAISPDKRLVATGSWDHSAKLWDADTGRAIRKLSGHTNYINTIEFSPDGSELLTASDDGTARRWSVTTGEPIGVPLSAGNARITTATYSLPNATRILTTTSDGRAEIWDRATGDPVKPLVGHEYAVLCGRFSPDGQRVITGGQDNVAIIWNAVSGEPELRLQGHTAAVTAVAFSPDGTRVLTGSRDNSARLWDARTGKEILPLPGHTQEVTAVSFSPDGRYVLTASRDGKAILWLADDWHGDVAFRTVLGR